MGYHYIGRVVLFDKPPEAEQISIEIPVYERGSTMDDRFLIQMADGDLDAAGINRKNNLLSRTTIPPEILEKYASFGIEGIEAVLTAIQAEIDSGRSSFIWDRYPTFNQLVSTLDLAWSNLKFNKGFLYTARTAAFYASRLAAASGNYRLFLNDLISDEDDSEKRSEIIDKAFSALRTLEFWVPSVLGLIETLILTCVDTEEAGTPNYQNYMAALENLFSNPLARSLDEFGLPAPLASKILLRNKGISSIDDAVDTVHLLKNSSALADFLTPAERIILQYFE
jgi:hypothetical protein